MAKFDVKAAVASVKVNTEGSGKAYIKEMIDTSSRVVKRIPLDLIDGFSGHPFSHGTGVSRRLHPFRGNLHWSVSVDESQAKRSGGRSRNNRNESVRKRISYLKAQFPFRICVSDELRNTFPKREKRNYVAFRRDL